VELREDDIDLAALFQVAARFGQRAPSWAIGRGRDMAPAGLLAPVAPETAGETAGLPARTVDLLRLRH
jgi:hypothetical protein